MWFDRIKKYYDEKHPRYTNESLKVFVVAGMLALEQYFEITGVPYE